MRRDKQQKIIDALEAIPAEERTPEMDSGAGPCLQQSGRPTQARLAKKLLKKALALLKPHEEYFEDDLLLELPHGLLLLIIWIRRAGLCDILKRHWKSALVIE